MGAFTIFYKVCYKNHRKRQNICTLLVSGSTVLRNNETSIGFQYSNEFYFKRQISEEQFGKRSKNLQCITKWTILFICGIYQHVNLNMQSLCKGLVSQIKKKTIPQKNMAKDIKYRKVLQNIEKRVFMQNMFCHRRYDVRFWESSRQCGPVFIPSVIRLHISYISQII